MGQGVGEQKGVGGGGVQQKACRDTTNQDKSYGDMNA